MRIGMPPTAGQVCVNTSQDKMPCMIACMHHDTVAGLHRPAVPCCDLLFARTSCTIRTHQARMFSFTAPGSMLSYCMQPRYARTACWLLIWCGAGAVLPSSSQLGRCEVCSQESRRARLEVCAARCLEPFGLSFGFTKQGHVSCVLAI